MEKPHYKFCPECGLYITRKQVEMWSKNLVAYSNVSFEDTDMYCPKCKDKNKVSKLEIGHINPENPVYEQFNKSRNSNSIQDVDVSSVFGR